MPIDTQHPEYARMFPIWESCEAALQGQTAVKAARTKYLRPTSGMQRAMNGGDSSAYDAYLHRARFNDIPNDSLEGVLGVMFAKPPLGYAPGVAVTIDGLDSLALARETARAVYSKGRHILVVDAPQTGGVPYVAQYRAESLINWDVDGSGNLTLAVFTESAPADSDPFSHDVVTRYRVYTPGSVQVYDESLDPIGEPIAITPGPLPIVIIGAVDNNASCDRPPVARIAECAFSAYSLSADYKQQLFQSAQATPWVNGVNDDQFKLIRDAGIGAGALWHLGDSGSAGFLEFDGAGSESLKTAIDDELALAAQYAVKLVDQGAGVESAEAKSIRDRAQKSAIQTMADSISAGITEALRIRAKMAGQPEPEPFVIQMEESQDRAEATMIQALGAQANAGNLPPVALYNYAVKSGLFAGSYDEWQAQLQGAVA